MIFVPSKRRRAPKRKRLIVLGCILLLLFLAVSLYAEIRIRPLVYAKARTQVQRMCVSAVDKAADYAVRESGIQYSDLITIERNERNEVTAVSSDIAALNELKTLVSAKIEEEIGNVGRREIKIPLGSLTSSGFLTGRGPDITVTLTVSSSCEAQIKSEFESVGINQTRHRIILVIECEVVTVMLDKTETMLIPLSVPIAETVIVGSVPNTYLNLD